MATGSKRRITKKGREKAELYDFFAKTYIRHTDRDWYDQPFVLDPWQFNKMWLPVFGTLKPDGRRWYNKALFGLPRFYGKSEFAARIVLTIMNMEPVPNGEYGIVATSREQAHIVFDKVAAMIRLNPELAATYEVLKKEIVHRETGASFRTYPAEEAAVQGHHFVVCILDETHVWKNIGLYSAVVSGMQDRNSLLVIITTASKNRKGPLWDYIKPKLEADPHAYTFWHGASDKADWRSRKTWEKVCIASWRTIEDMEDDYNTLPFSDFLRYSLNVFPPDNLGEDMAFDPAQVDACLDDGDFDWDRTMAIGIDGAMSGDSFAIVFSGAREDGGVDWYPVIYTQGTDEGRYDLVQIEELVSDYYNSHDIQRVAVDPYRLLMFSQHLKDRYGIPVETYAQNDANMAAASEYILRLITDGILHIYGSDRFIMAEHLKNVVRGSAHAYGWRMSKTADRAKIDGAIAGAMSAVVLDSTVGDGWSEILTL